MFKFLEKLICNNQSTSQDVIQPCPADSNEHCEIILRIRELQDNLKKLEKHNGVYQCEFDMAAISRKLFGEDFYRLSSDYLLTSREIPLFDALIRYGSRARMSPQKIDMAIELLQQYKENAEFCFNEEKIINDIKDEIKTLKERLGIE